MKNLIRITILSFFLFGCEKEKTINQEPRVQTELSRGGKDCKWDFSVEYRPMGSRVFSLASGSGLARNNIVCYSTSGGYNNMKVTSSKYDDQLYVLKYTGGDSVTLNFKFEGNVQCLEKGKHHRYFIFAMNLWPATDGLLPVNTEVLDHMGLWRTPVFETEDELDISVEWDYTFKEQEMYMQFGFSDEGSFTTGDPALYSIKGTLYCYQ